MRRCSVFRCKSYSGKGRKCTFYSFPSDPNLVKKWKAFCDRPKDFNTLTAKICYLHFIKSDFERNLKYEMGITDKNFEKLKPGIVPTVKGIIPEDLCSAESNNKSFQEEYIKNIESKSNKIFDESSPPPECKSPNSYLPKRDYEKEFYIKFAVSSDHQYASVTSKKYTEDEVEPDENQQCTSEISESEIKEDIIEANEDEHLTYDQPDSLDSLKRENYMLKKHERKLNLEINNLKRTLAITQAQKNNLENRLKVIFSECQLKKLKNGTNRTKWSETDIAQSLTWYTSSPRTYILLSKTRFPLPAIRTLQKWARKIDISPGILNPALKILKAATHLKAAEKVCVLSFDEFRLKQNYYYDRSSDTTIAPYSAVKVAMLRGLMTRWKQPIYYSFDCKITKCILLDILKKTKACGYSVVAVVAKLGAENKELFDDLGVQSEQPWFSFDNNKVYAFAEVPHLMKVFRNQFLDNGFVINGKEVSKDIIVKLLEISSSSLTKTLKISMKHVNVVGNDRQKLKLATELISKSTSKSLTLAASQGYLSDENWEECSELLHLASNWFDVMNVTTDTKKHSSSYGQALEIQNQMLDEMVALVLNMRVVGKSNLHLFQKGIILSINALKSLFIDLQNRFGFKSILTCRLNNDALENFYGIICSSSCFLNDLPNCQQFKYRLRNQIIGANIETDDRLDLKGSSEALSGNFQKLKSVIERNTDRFWLRLQLSLFNLDSSLGCIFKDLA